MPKMYIFFRIYVSLSALSQRYQSIISFLSVKINNTKKSCIKVYMHPTNNEKMHVVINGMHKHKTQRHSHIQI